MNDYSSLDGVEDTPDILPAKEPGSHFKWNDALPAPNTDIIDIEGIGTVDVSKLSFVGDSAINNDLMRFEVIIDGLSRYWVTSEDAYTSLLTAMRGRP